MQFLCDYFGSKLARWREPTSGSPPAVNLGNGYGRFKCPGGRDMLFLKDEALVRKSKCQNNMSEVHGGH